MPIKKIMLSMMILVLLIGTVSIATAKDIKTDSMDLSSAVEMALENDLTLKTINNRILLADRHYRSAVYKADEVDLNPSSDEQLLKNGLAYAYEPVKKEHDLLDLKIEQIQREKEVKTEVAILYSSIIRQIDAINQLKKELETLTIEVKNQDVLFKNGKITNATLEGYNVQLRSTELDGVKADRTLDNLYMDLNLKLGKELDSRPTLNPEDIIKEVVIDYDIKTLIDFMKTSSELVYNAEVKLKLAILEKETTYRYYRYERPDNYEDLEKAVINLEESLEQARETAQIDLMTAYNNLLNKNDDLTIAKLKLDMAVDSLDITKMRYDLGLNTYLDVKKAKDNVTAAENTVFKTLIDLYKQQSDFDLTISFSTEIE